MKIALINGSPKTKASASKSLLDDLKHYFPEQTQITEFAFHTPELSPDTIQELYKADAWIFSFPLYVDGIPGQLLSCLVQLDETIQQGKTAEADLKQIRIYGIVNCGFYEGIQAEYALQILQNWCNKTGYLWGGGIGVGGGGGLAQMPNTESGHGPREPINHALSLLSEKILTSDTTENSYVSVAFPRHLYKMAAQFGWRQLIRANGGKAKDLGKKL